MKRTNKIIFCLNDAELAALNSLQQIYSIDGHAITKSFLIRYGLKRLPHQHNFIPA